MQKQAEQNEIQFRKNKLLLAELRQEQSRLQDEYLIATALEKEFFRLQEIRRKLENLSAKTEEIVQKRKLLALKEFAAVYFDWKRAREKTAVYRKTHRDQEQMLGENQQKIKNYEKTIAFCEKRISELQKVAAEEPRCAAVCEKHRLAAEKETEIVRTMGILQCLGNEVDFLTDLHTEKQKIYQKLSKTYWKQTEFSLASALREGKACPVCGSMTHPKPAKSPRGKQITAVQVEEALAQLEAAEQAMTQKCNELHILRLALQKQQQELREQGLYSTEEVMMARQALEAARDAKRKLSSVLEKHATTTEHLKCLHDKQKRLLSQREERIPVLEQASQEEQRLFAKILALDPEGVHRAEMQEQNLSVESYWTLEQEIEAYEESVGTLTALEQMLTKQLAGQKQSNAAVLRAKLDAINIVLKNFEQEELMQVCPQHRAEYPLEKKVMMVE